MFAIVMVVAVVCMHGKPVRKRKVLSSAIVWKRSVWEKMLKTVSGCGFDDRLSSFQHIHSFLVSTTEFCVSAARCPDRVVFPWSGSLIVCPHSCSSILCSSTVFRPAGIGGIHLRPLDRKRFPP